MDRERSAEQGPGKQSATGSPRVGGELQPGKRTLTEALPAGPSAAPQSIAAPATTESAPTARVDAGGLGAYRAKLVQPGYAYLRRFAEPVIAALEAGSAAPQAQQRERTRLDAMFSVSHSPDGHGMPEIKQASNDHHAELGAEARQKLSAIADRDKLAVEAPRIAATFAPRLEDGVQMTAALHPDGVELRIAPNDWWELLLAFGIGVGIGIGVGVALDRLAEPEPLPDRRESYTALDRRGRSRPASDAATVLDAADNAVAAAAPRAVPGAQGAATGAAHTFQITIDGQRFTIRLMACPLGDRVIKTVVNPTKDAHVLQISDRAAAGDVERAVAHGIAEIAELRRAARANEFPIDQDLLHRGARIGRQETLSARDLGALAEIRTLCAQHQAAQEDARAPIRRELLTLVDDLGLRRGTDGADARWAVIRGRLSEQQQQILDPVRLGVGQLSRPDADHLRDQQLESDRQRQQRDQRQAPVHDVPNPRRRISLDEATRMAAAAQRRRADKSAATLATYRQRAQDRQAVNDYPRVNDPQLGGGAALSGVRPGQLLIDDRGRWQADPSHAIAQTAIQLRSMLDAGLGDPLQFVDHPNDRPPLAAIRYFEDTIAAQADVINGTGGLALDAQARMLLTIRPSNGTATVVVQVDGAPVIASGFPRERLPNQQMSTYTAVTTLMAALAHSVADDAAAARNALATVDLGNAGAVGGVLGAHPNARQELTGNNAVPVQNALAVLNVHRDWSQLRTDRTERIMQGDQANLSTLDPRAAARWVITGVGGTSISAAEIILHGNREAKVTMIGGNLPPGLNTNDQFRAVYTTYGPTGQNRFDIISGQRLGAVTANDGGATVSTGEKLSGGAKIDANTTVDNVADPAVANDWIALAAGPLQIRAAHHVLTTNPAAKMKLVARDIPANVRRDQLFVRLVADYGPASPTPRLDIASGAYFAAIEDGPNNTFQTSGRVTGEGFVNALGRAGQAAPMIEDLLRRALRDGHATAGELLWSDDGEYLGYRIRIGAGATMRSFDVTGAASRFLPEGVFTAQQRDLVMARPGHTAPSSDRDAPPESGNFDGGFASSATQASRYARQARTDRARVAEFQHNHPDHATVTLTGIQPAQWEPYLRATVAGELEVEQARVTVTRLTADLTPTPRFKVTLGAVQLGELRGFSRDIV
jgi:hypothetical protein